MTISQINPLRMVPNYMTQHHVEPDAQLEYFTGTSPQGQPCLLLYAGKSKRPALFYGYPTEAKLQERLEEHLANYRAAYEAKQREKKERAARRTQTCKLKVGDILVASWGYEQTNVDFYEVTAQSGRKVVLTPVASQSTQETGWASDKVIACAGNYTGAPFEATVQYGDSVNIKSYITACLWDGTPRHRSWYA